MQVGIFERGSRNRQVSQLGTIGRPFSDELGRLLGFDFVVMVSRPPPDGRSGAHILDQVLWRVDCHHLSAGDDGDTVCQRRRFLEVVGGQQDRRAGIRPAAG